MEQSQSRYKKPSPYDRAWFITKVIFFYVFPTFLLGYRNNGLSNDDLFRCPKDDIAEKVTRNLISNWEAEKKKKSPSYGRALIRTFAPSFFVPLCIYLFEECFLRIIQPLMLGEVIKYFSGLTTDYQWACLNAGGVCLCTAIFISMHHPTMLRVMRVGMRLRVASVSLMFTKALRLSRASVGQTAVGQIVNIMSNDVNRFDEFSIFLTYLIVAPIQTGICVYIVWGYLGVACFAGIALLLLFIPFQGLMGKMFSKVRSATAQLTDTRLRYMNETVGAMRVIKMYCWEGPFSDRVANARKAEVQQVNRAAYLKGLNLSLFFVVSRIILFVCFVVYVLAGNALSSEGVFVSMALLNTLRLNMTFFFPQAIGLLAECRITCKRIEKFLLLEEMSNDWEPSLKPKEKKVKGALKGRKEVNYPKAVEPSLVVNNIIAKWSSDMINPTLKNITARLKPGELLAVIGPVGSGKSSFLMALLKELPLESGKIDLQGTISYSSQDSWNFNDSVRDNILFGLDFDEKKYQTVVDVCALQRDLKLMPFGDRTLVGEKGVSLSGGQKARINLARAVYRDADILLLDDPLSAVDTSVAEHIFEKCIMDHLKSRIRILVTHQIQFIQKATKILILKEGNCLAYGNFNELQQMGIDFMSLLAEPESKDGDDSGDAARDRTASERSIGSQSRRSNSSVSANAMVGRSRTLSTGTVENFQVPQESADGGVAEENKKIKVEEEQSQRGSIKGRIYLEYLKAGGSVILLCSMIIFTIISQTIFHGSDLFLTAWTNKNQATNGTVNIEERNQDIYIYTGLIVVLFVSTILRSITFFAICMRASVRLHNKIFGRLIRAPVAFFDSNPAGRILNRFTKDLGIIDESLPNTAYDLNLTICQGIGIIVTVSIVNWILALPALVVIGAIIYIRGIYIISARDIKRYESLARSPVYSHVSTTINGLASIRAYGAQTTFEKQFYVYLNDHSGTWFIYLSSSRAMGLLMDWLTTIYIFVISAVVMTTHSLAGGDAGLAISSGLMLAGMTQWGVRQSAEFESQMTSVERIVEYQDLEQEAPAESTDKLKPTKDWPSSGQIEMNQMSLAYPGSEKPVLKNLTCTIQGGEKIGIVGRTGAGKSSMIAALFRLTEPTGAIRIDGVDIQSIGLDDLRKKISIIPQDPVIFSGTVRYNLDPFSEYPDSDLWAALEEVQLKSQVENYTGQLDAKLSDSGSNLSVGQRQLICLARAIIRRNRILICDEATSNIDHVTDGLIQATIRNEFASCTVLTIAHRLNTIIDCDRVLVLDAGEILEFDTPYALLKNKHVFYDMCKKTGPSMFSHLNKLAKITYHKKEKLTEQKESGPL